MEGNIRWGGRKSSRSTLAVHRTKNSSRGDWREQCQRENKAQQALKGQRRKGIEVDSLLYQQTRHDDITKASFVNQREKLVRRCHLGIHGYFEMLHCTSPSLRDS